LRLAGHQQTLILIDTVVSSHASVEVDLKSQDITVSRDNCHPEAELETLNGRDAITAPNS